MRTPVTASVPGTESGDEPEADNARLGDHFQRLWNALAPYMPGVSQRRARTASRRLLRVIETMVSAGTIINAISNLTQDRFLAFCTGLEKLHAGTLELVHECEHLIVLASGREDGRAILDSTLDLISQPLDFISGWSGDADLLISGLRNALQAVEKLASVENAVRRTLAPLRYIHTLLGVETANMSAEFQTVFLKVREDIEMLQQRMDAAFAQQFDAVGTIRSELVAIVKEVTDDVAAQRSIVENKRGQIAAAIAQSRENIVRSARLGSSLERAARDLAAEVSHIVVALQSQDIVAQKLSHIHAAIEPLSSMARRLASDPAGSETALQLEQVARVQIAQTDAAGEDIHHAKEALGSAVKTVIQRIAQIDQECLALGDVKQVTAGMGGIVQVLLDTTSEVRLLVAAAAAAADNATKKVQPLAALAANLTGSMDLVAHSMRMIALNAQVQAVRLGQGTGTEVLSAEAARISEETSVVCETAVGEIAAIGQLLGNNLAGFDDLRARAHELDCKLCAEGAQSDLRLHHYRNSMLASMSNAGELSQSSREKAEGLTELLDFGERTGPQILQLRELFVNAESAAAHCLASVDRNSISSAAQCLEHNYTMRAERAVHAQVLGAGSASAHVDNGELDLF